MVRLPERLRSELGKLVCPRQRVAVLIPRRPPPPVSRVLSVVTASGGGTQLFVGSCFDS